MRADRTLDLTHLAVLVCAAAFPIRLPAEGIEDRGTRDPVTRTVVRELAGVRGASDLAADPEGHLWAITERTHALVSIETSGAESDRLLPIEGVPEGLDLESFAFIGPGQIVIGTETSGRRSRDLLLFAEVLETRVVITRQLAVEYAPLGLEAAPNGGLEGLCVADHTIVVGLETAQRRAGRRVGALIVVTATAVAHVALGTSTGKISALFCEKSGADRLSVWAIERHYGISRLVHFDLTLPVPSGPIEPELWSNLATTFEGHVPNIEGVVVDREGIWLVEDNDPGQPEAPTRVHRVVSRGGSGNRAGPEAAETR